MLTSRFRLCIRPRVVTMTQKTHGIILSIFMASSLMATGDEYGDRASLLPPETPTRVHIGIRLLHVLNIDPASELSPKVTARFRVQTQWQDHRLSPLTDEVMDLQGERVSEQLKTIFDPQITIANGTFELDHQRLFIYHNGTVHVNQVVTVVVPADMNLVHFPFDSQTFEFQFSSSYWDAKQVDLIVDPVDTGMDPGAQPASWWFDNSSFYTTKGTVREQMEEFFVFTFLVHAQRDPRYFIWRLLIPLIVIVMLSWNVFWMYEDASSALGNSFVFLLTVVAFHQIANTMLPLIPSFTFMDAIVFISYGFIIVPTFQVMITTKLDRQGQSEKAETIRQYCRFSIPIAFIVTLLSTTLYYFIQS